MQKFHFVVTLMMSMLLFAFHVYALGDAGWDYTECRMYMAPSTVPGAGRGIFAAVPMISGQLLEYSPTLTIAHSVSGFWALNNYVYGSNIEKRSLAIFGSAMLYNHQSELHMNSHHFWSEHNVECGIETGPQSTSTPVAYYTTKDIEVGSELFSSYGDSSWFKDRNISYEDNTNTSDKFQHSLEYLEEHGYCMTDVFVAMSHIPMAGKGLFARKNFTRGDTIYVSPALLLPKNEVYASGYENALVNYCFSSPSDTGVLVFPVGLSSITNHQSSKLANMKYEWLNPELVHQDPKILFGGSTLAPLDVKYTAIRDIKAGEELTMDYGEAWINAWATYLATKLSNLNETNAKNVTFRYAIQAHEEFIPKSWDDVSCIGEQCAHMQWFEDQKEKEKEKEQSSSLSSSEMDVNGEKVHTDVAN